MRKTFIYLIVIGVICSCSTSSDYTPSESSNETPENTSIIQGTAIVEFSEEMAEMIEASTSNGSIATKSSELNEILQTIGVTSLERKFPDAGKWEARHREAGLHRWYKVTYDPSVAVTKAEDGILSVPGVISVETPRKKKSSATFNDPYARYQWGFKNEGSGTSFTAGCDINVTPVWENYTAGRNDVIVAVIDAGVQLNHEDLSGITLNDKGEGSKTFISRRSSVTPDDHGTHVAGIIAGINNNGTGIMGVAGGYDGNGGVKIMSLEIIADDPNDPENVLNGDEAEAFVWAADHGAVIANNSWGFSFETEDEAKAETLPSSTKQGIDYFIKYAGIDEKGNQTGPMRGGVVIFAAGNEGWQYALPASYDQVIAVGAIKPNGARTSYSNYGDWVDICAPGGSANSDTKQSILSSVTNNQYGYMSGTSMACPYVSGVAALIVSYYGKQGFTNDELKARLLEGANTSIVSPSSKIGGLVDAYGSFYSPSTIAPDPVKEYTVTAESNKLTFNWNVTADEDDGKASGYTVVVGKNKTAVSNFKGDGSDSDIIKASVTTTGLNVGDKLSTTISDLDFTQTYYTKIIAFDPSRNYSYSAIKEVNTGKNNPPIITCNNVSDMYTIKASGSLQLEFTINDPDGHYFYAMYSNATVGEAFSERGGKYIVRINGLAIDPGTYKSTVTAKDDYGLTTTYDINFTVLENHAPVVKNSIENILLFEEGESKTINLDDYFYDEDEETLTCKVSYYMNDFVSHMQNGSDLRFKPLKVGRTECYITVSDARGMTASQTIVVVVRQKGSEIEFFPNPVKDYLNISTAEKEETSTVTITSETGKVFYSGQQTSSAFSPAKIDMSSYQSGLYKVNVKFSDREYNQTITKSK